ncbi:polysaccharide biosynthesis protein [Chryseosolibacter indicus]|uniref:Polysaccharide biosynthesis protein n=1 Tax=Chryseosolibacter indicus TaxID=2782351 RepID=A0ABS5VWY6_9BACT|nr:nucleoside-diphosphate sugar epimerase/dehydratase [Chryseosolibacter indicus]MBT1705352.1 polysaccharide biosynthesis protein [Chryseosolibacter indicus]
MFQYSVIKWFYSLSILPRWVIILIDILFLAFSTVLAYLLRFNFVIEDIIKNHFFSGLILSIACGAISIIFLGSYKGIVRYTGIQDGVRIFFTLILNLAFVCVVNLVVYANTGVNLIPYSVVLISYLASFLFLFNYRLLVKYVFSFYRKGVLKNSKVLIFGSGQTGLITKHVIDSSPLSKVYGFLEDDERKIGKVINGSKIYSAKQEDLEELLVNLGIDELIITVKNLSISRKNELVDTCLKFHVKIRIVPPVDRWVKGELSLNQIKEINIEDLLGRDVIRLTNPELRKNIAGKNICITGAAGSIGSELVRQIVQYHPSSVILIDQAESPLFEIDREVQSMDTGVKVYSYVADITQEERLVKIFGSHQIHTIFHAAAYKHVPLMESNPAEAVRCNILGTKILADLAVHFHVERFVMISTDKAVNPTNVMGCSKRIAEIYVQSLNRHLEDVSIKRTRFITTRFGNVLGSNGSVIPVFKKQIEAGGPITVTHPSITRYFMTIPEACQLVLEAGVMGRGGEIFIFDMGESVKIVDLAKKMILLSGLEPDRDIDIVFTGLRDGEKLYEELLNNHENTMPTHHQKIMIARVREYEYARINHLIDLFNDNEVVGNELRMVSLMKEIVPEYKSKFSRFEALDTSK